MPTTRAHTAAVLAELQHIDNCMKHYVQTSHQPIEIWDGMFVDAKSDRQCQDSVLLNVNAHYARDVLLLDYLVDTALTHADNDIFKTTLSIMVNLTAERCCLPDLLMNNAVARHRLLSAMPDHLDAIIVVGNCHTAAVSRETVHSVVDALQQLLQSCPYCESTEWALKEWHRRLALA